MERNATLNLLINSNISETTTDFGPTSFQIQGYYQTIRRRYIINFKNFSIDMKNLLGDMYDVYDYYKINCTYVCSVPTASFIPSTKYLDVSMYMEGLNFQNCSIYGQNTNQWNFAIYHFQDDNNSRNILYQSDESNYAIFRKTEYLSDLTIYYETIDTSVNVTDTFTGLYPNMYFQFKITPIAL